jgi:serine/threonine protein kinase
VFEKEKYNVGSPLYMSPEALKKNIYSVKNDIWSIGIMIFELLHGETPWECKTEKELMDKIIEEHILPKLRNIRLKHFISE